MEKPQTKAERIEAEYNRLAQYYKGIPAKQRATVEHLIQNCAFMAITLQDLQKAINEAGAVEEYQNGANQRGIKTSAELQAYNQTFKSYQTATKQLLSLLPVKSTADSKTGLEAYIQLTEQKLEEHYKN